MSSQTIINPCPLRIGGNRECDPIYNAKPLGREAHQVAYSSAVREPVSPRIVNLVGDANQHARKSKLC